MQFANVLVVLKLDPMKLALEAGFREFGLEFLAPVAGFDEDVNPEYGF